jgi:uncharacterized membrane protein YdjX (TVP38/TMEM64 family)
VIISVYSVIVTRQFFVGNNVGQLEPQIKSFGVWAPFIIFGLIFLCIVIPPFPLPIPPLEIIAGATIGFVPGIILVWSSQFASSLFAYWLTEYIPKSFVKNIIGNRFYKPYKKFIEKRGVLAVFVVRATMIAPFSISYLAGLSKVNFKGFTLATALGIIPEALIFVYLGTIFAHSLGIQFWYIFIVFVAIGVIPIILWLIKKLFSK